MSNLIETITVTLFLLLGLNAFSLTHASTDIEPTSEEIVRDCPISGQVNIRLNGSVRNGQLMGEINNETVFLNVFNGRVTGFINGQSVSLIIEPERNEYVLSGWLGFNRIRWTSFGGMFHEWIYCQ